MHTNLHRNGPENDDARSYILLGDPAVRIPFAKPGEEWGSDQRPVIAISEENKGKLAGALSVPPTLPTPPSSGAPAPSSDQTTSQQPTALEMTAWSVQVQAERSSLTDSIKQFTSQLAESLKSAADDISSLEVITYSTDDLNKVTYNYDDKKLHGELKMRALDAHRLRR